MSRPDTLTVNDLDLDLIDKSSHYRAGDKVYKRVGNADGSPLYVALSDDPLETELQAFEEILNVLPNTVNEIISYTVPVGKILNLDKIETSGDNVAKYTVKINGQVNKVARANIAASFNVNFNYNSVRLIEGETISVEVEHFGTIGGLGNNPDFNATIEGKLK
jgi:hypothetical protein